MTREFFETERDVERQRLTLSILRRYWPGELRHIPSTRNVSSEDAQWIMRGRLYARVELKWKLTYGWPLWVKRWQMELLCQPPMGIIVWFIPALEQLLCHRVDPHFPYPKQSAHRNLDVARDAQDLHEDAVGVYRHQCYTPDELIARMSEDEAVGLYGF
jgi:hypothetical protein